MRPSFQRGLYRSNAQGFRSPSDFTKPCDIVVAGDSFTFGMGVPYEQTFPALIGAYNLGMPGFGMDQIWQTVRTQALPLRPKLVIVAFISADFTRSEEAYRQTEGFNKPSFKLASNGLVPKTPEDQPLFPLRFLQAHSSVWRVMSLADRTLAHRYPHGNWWKLNAAILDAIREDCRKANVPVLFLYIPSREWGAFPALNRYMMHENFIDISRGRFALTPEMYIPKDGHLNEKGDRQIAEAVRDFAYSHHRSLVTSR